MSMLFINTNLEAWDKRTKVHVKSCFYDVEGFLKGKCTLHKPELDLIPDVAGKRLLHLQCHFGLDTLSWARRGAHVTGVDLSPLAIDKAISLSTSLNIEADFYACDVQQLDGRYKDKFDIVYSSYGVLCWLQNLDLWANSIWESLKTGGKFVLVEYHPVLDLVFDGYLSGQSQYFQNDIAIMTQSRGTYTDVDDPITYAEYRWPHPLSEVFCALLKAGLSIESFNEYPYSPYRLFKPLNSQKEGVWYDEMNEKKIPYLFSLVVKK